MNEHEKEKFKLNLRMIRNGLNCISNEKIASEKTIKNEVGIIRRLLEECEELATK